MYTKEITANGDYEILNFKTKVEGATVAIEANPDTATIGIGYKGSDGLFHPYALGAALTTDLHILVGEGVTLMARVADTSGGTLKITTFTKGA